MSTLSDLIAADDSPEPQTSADSSFPQYPPDEQSYPVPESPNEIESPPKVFTEVDIALNGENGDPLPATELMLCVDRLYSSFNNLILDFMPEPGITAPQAVDIRESAEFNVKTVRLRINFTICF